MRKKSLFGIGLVLCLALAMTGPVFTEQICPPHVVQLIIKDKVIAEDFCFLRAQQLRGNVQVLGNNTLVDAQAIYGNFEVESFACVEIGIFNNVTTLFGNIECDFPSFVALSNATIIRGNVDDNCILVDKCGALNETNIF